MNDAAARQALASLRLNWVMRSHGVWESVEGYVPQLHQGVTDEVARGIREARERDPLGMVLEGEAGTGKTHLLGWVRERVQRDGGYFFLVALAHGETFWESVLEAMLDGFWRPYSEGGATQLQVLLTRLEQYDYASPGLASTGSSAASAPMPICGRRSAGPHGRSPCTRRMTPPPRMWPRRTSSLMSWTRRPGRSPASASPRARSASCSTCPSSSP